MKKDLHPEWYSTASVTCACGNTWETGAAVPEIRTDICSACHPFYTGEQRIVDTEGRVDKFLKRLRQRDVIANEAEDREASKTPADLPIEELGLNTRTFNVLQDNDVRIVDDIINKFTADGDDAFLEMSGIGRQALADIKKSLRNAGYEVPEQEEAEVTE